MMMKMSSIHCQKTQVAQFHFAPKYCQSLQPHPHPLSATSPKFRTNIRAYADVITIFSGFDGFSIFP